MAQRLAAAAALVVLAFGAAACGGGDDGEGVPRLDGGAAADTTADASQDPQDAMLAYAECMRKNGVDMPDPQGGGFVITPETQDNSAEGRRKFEEADKQCRKHLANLAPPKLTEEQKAEMREAMVEHTRCMREHGIDIPDPQFREGGGAAIPLDSIDLDDPEFQAAQKACEKHLRQLPMGPGR